MSRTAAGISEHARKRLSGCYIAVAARLSRDGLLRVLWFSGRHYGNDSGVQSLRRAGNGKGRRSTGKQRGGAESCKQHGHRTEGYQGKP